MARIKTVPIINLTLAFSLTALLAACSAPGPSALVVKDANPSDARVSAKTYGIEPELAAALDNAEAPRAFLKAEDIEVDAPDTYEVVDGDTLWDISDRFLNEPWRWTEIWGYNPQVYDPNLIYPGDKLALEYVNEQPTLVLTRNGKLASLAQRQGQGRGRAPTLGGADPIELDADGNPLPQTGGRVRLSPSIRTESLDSAVPTIAADSIQQFLVHPRVVDTDTIENAAYVLTNLNNSLVSSLGNQIYARGQMNRNQTAYSIYRQNKPLYDPTNKELLGYEITHVANAKLLNIGDPSTLTITQNKMETIAGDIILPAGDDSVSHQYTTRLPDLEGEVRIVSLVNAISQTGRDQVVVLNVGSNSGVQVGDILAIESRGRMVDDPRAARSQGKIELPNARTGVLMVFKAFDKVSYGLVMESTSPVLMNDIVTGI